MKITDCEGEGWGGGVSFRRASYMKVARKGKVEDDGTTDRSFFNQNGSTLKMQLVGGRVKLNSFEGEGEGGGGQTWHNHLPLILT